MNSRKPKEQKKQERKEALESSVENCNFGDPPTLSDLAGAMGISERSVRDRIKEHGGFEIVDGVVQKKTD